MPDEYLKKRIDEDEERLEELEREERRIETSDHRGFRDAVLRSKLAGEIALLDTTLLHERERLTDDQE
ncbi:MAG: hypothetical protein ABSE46_23540 [Terracidiphilus sp.]|jgi:hypothetical protein